MGTYNKPGNVLTFVAPTGGVTVDVPVIIGRRLVVPKTTAAVSEEFEGYTEGVFYLSKTSGETWVTGQPLYWSTGNSKLSNVATAGLKVAEVGEAAGSAATSGYAKLLPPSSAAELYQVRKRCTLAEVNADVVLLPAIDNFKYRMIDCSIIAIGGAAAAGTTVDIIGTQSASAVLLVAFAQASLTQSTELRAGDSGGTILADGASYVACDENTAISVGATGTFTTATHFDVIFSYAIDAA